MVNYVFIISNIHLPRCANRVNEFVSRGCKVEAYYFDRPLYKHEIKNIYAPLHYLGDLESGGASYWGRIYQQYKKVKEVVKKYKNTDTVIYLFGFDMALVYYFSKIKLPYIFEESDLRHTYFKPSFIAKYLERLDKKIIKKALLTVFTSEGFYKYHFGSEKLDNVVVVPNRLDPEILKQDNVRERVRKPFNPGKIKIGFVGSIRFKTVYNFVDVFCRTYPQCEFHFYGSPVRDNIEDLKKYNNCHFHGVFSSPRDLPEIYSNIDLVLSTYDTDFENALYAEPNKMYEAMFFDVPIIVSSGTFVADKVNELGIGYDVNAMKDDEVLKLIETLTVDCVNEKVKNIERIPKENLVSVNDELFAKLEEKKTQL